MTSRCGSLLLSIVIPADVRSSDDVIAFEGPTALMSLIVAESFTELPHLYNATHVTEDMAGLNDCNNITHHDYCCRDGDDQSCTPVNMAIAVS